MLNLVYIHQDSNFSLDEEDAIELGASEGLEDFDVVNFMNRHTYRIDKLIELEFEITGHNSLGMEQLNKVRFFNYAEYRDLFNNSITPDLFDRYPVFQALDIYSEIDRNNYTIQYQYNEYDYLQLFLAKSPQSLMRFLRSKFMTFRKIPIKSLFQNTSILAPTGSGKSVFLSGLTYRLIRKMTNCSFVIIDPHGSVANRLYRASFPNADDRIMYFDPKFIAKGNVFSYNVLGVKDISILNINHTIDEIEAALQDVLDREGGEIRLNMGTILRKCLHFLLKRGNSTLNDLLDLVCKKEPILSQAQEYDDYFSEEFLHSESRTVDAVRRRMRAIIDDPIASAILGSKSTFDFEKALNSDKILIFNLASLGELSQISIGKFLIANIKSYVRKREKDSEGLHHTFLVIDECHNFVSGTYEYMLEQLRGYGLHCILCNQYAGQLGSNLDSVRENTAVKVVAGEYVKNVNAMVEVPRKFIKKNPYSKDDFSTTLLDLKEYEFLLKIRNKPRMSKFKSPDFMIKNNRYQISDEELSLRNKNQLEKYYKPFGIEEPKTNRKTKIEDNEPENRSNNAPPFDLYIDADDPTIH